MISLTARQKKNGEENKTDKRFFFPRCLRRKNKMDRGFFFPRCLKRKNLISYIKAVLYWLFLMLMLYNTGLYHHQKRFGSQRSARIKKRHHVSAHVNSLLRVVDVPKIWVRIWMSQLIPARQFGGSHPLFLEKRGRCGLCRSTCPQCQRIVLDLFVYQPGHISCDNN